MNVADGWAVVKWWLVAQALGWSMWPIAFRLLRWLPDRGYTLARPLGLLLVAYGLWLAASLGILPNAPIGIAIVWLLVAGWGSWWYRRRPAAEATVSLCAIWRDHRRVLLAYEALFALALIAWAIFRAHAPDAVSGEKPMELAFLNAINRSVTFPPQDPWLAGFPIAYYYFGYVVMAILGKAAGTSIGVTFALSNALWFALTAAGAFGVVTSLVRLSAPRARTAIAGGLIGAVLIAVMGNYEAPLEVARVNGLGSAAFWQQLDILDLNQPYERKPDQPSWPPRTGGFGWWWRASRVIHDYWPTTISPRLAAVTGLPPDSSTDFQELIDEFPQFSFIQGDMHPHVLGLPFVLLAIGLALNLYQAGSRGEARSLLRGVPGWPIYAVTLGGLAFLNTWDFPIYLTLMMLAFSLGRIFSSMFRWRALMIDLLVLGGLGWLMYWPFYQHFTSQAAGLSPNLFNGTSLAQFGVMFGPFLIVGGLLGVKVWRAARRAGDIRSGRWTLIALGSGAGLLGLLIAATGLLAVVSYRFIPAARTSLDVIIAAMGDRGLTLSAHLLARLREPWLPLLLAFSLASVFWLWRARRVSRSPLTFALLLYWLGGWLVLAPEFVYVTDVTGTRMNTVFKFYYQAWVMWSVATAWSVVYLLGQVRRTKQWAIAIVVVVAIGAGVLFPALALPTRLADFAGIEPTLDVLQAAARDPKIADVYAAAQWLNAHVSGTAIVLQTTNAVPWFESERARLASWTGLPTLLGWYNHETQWRGNDVVQRQRLPDINEIYATTDLMRAMALLKHYEVVYVYVGYEEQRQYPPDGLAKFDRLLTLVFQAHGVKIYRVP